MPTIRKLLKAATSRLEEVGIESARLDARLLIEHALGCDHSYIIINNTQLVKKTDTQLFETLLQRREKREPIASIIGRREFWSMDFKTSQHTLDPRPDSETLIEAVMRQRPDRAISYSMLDFGTGTGCLILSLLSEYTNAEAVAVDISEDALNIAKHNATELGLDNRTTFTKSVWGENIDGTFDIIISNPPYIPSAEITTLEPEVTDFDPHLALDGGKDGLDEYRRVIPDISRLLAPNGLCVIEFGEGQEENVKKICDENKLKFLKFEKDLTGIVRCIVVSN